MQVIGYTYEADYHCISCAEERFGVDQYGAVEGVDNEGNSTHPVFDTDEWYVNAIYQGETHDTLSCGTCHTTIAEWSDA